MKGRLRKKNRPSEAEQTSSDQGLRVYVAAKAYELFLKRLILTGFKPKAGIKG
jgi:hypothetical protein